MAETIMELAGSAGARKQTITLRPRSGWQAIGFRELWECRELIGFLAMRDIKVRYKQTALGAAWAVIQPLVAMVVFTVFFHRVAGVETTGGVPYEVLTFTALLPWQLFENGLTNAGNSLINNQQLISKVYFPRMGIPISSLVSGLLDFAIAFAVLLGLMAWFGIRPQATMLVMPAFLVLAVLAALGASLWLSALNVQYRDVRHAIPFLVRVWFFVTPVAYPIGQLPEKWRVLYGLNPMTSVVEGFRWAVLGHSDAPLAMVGVSVAVTAAVLVGGAFYFKRMERAFADVV